MIETLGIKKAHLIIAASVTSLVLIVTTTLLLTKSNSNLEPSVTQIEKKLIDEQTLKPEEPNKPEKKLNEEKPTLEVSGTPKEGTPAIGRPGALPVQSSNLPRPRLATPQKAQSKPPRPRMATPQKAQGKPSRPRLATPQKAQSKPSRPRMATPQKQPDTPKMQRQQNSNSDNNPSTLTRNKTKLLPPENTQSKGQSGQPTSERQSTSKIARTRTQKMEDLKEIRREQGFLTFQQQLMMNSLVSASSDLNSLPGMDDDEKETTDSVESKGSQSNEINSENDNKSEWERKHENDTDEQKKIINNTLEMKEQQQKERLSAVLDNIKNKNKLLKKVDENTDPKKPKLHRGFTSLEEAVVKSQGKPSFGETVVEKQGESSDQSDSEQWEDDEETRNDYITDTNALRDKNPNNAGGKIEKLDGQSNAESVVTDDVYDQTLPQYCDTALLNVNDQQQIDSTPPSQNVESKSQKNDQSLTQRVENAWGVKLKPTKK